MADKSKKTTNNPSDHSRNRRNEEEQRAKHWAREWADALLFAAIAALILRAFFFGAYRIPTPSMENTLMTGDFLIVSKMAYGARTPMTVTLPFTSVYIPGFDLPWTRLPGFKEIVRNDIVVFNYPVETGPVSIKTNYIKRLVGMPGDELEIVDKQLFVNGVPEEPVGTVMQHYQVEVRDRLRLSPTRISETGGNVVRSPQGDNSYRLNLTAEAAETVGEWSEVVSVDLFVMPPDYNEFSARGFSFATGFQNRHQMKPFMVPYSGQTVQLTSENWHIYQDVLERYERNVVEREGDAFVINGVETNEYTFRKDYYFMMGDNRDDSEDSRYWGFVPEDHVIGKASLIYFSWDGERGLPRFGRIMNLIHD